MGGAGFQGLCMVRAWRHLPVITYGKPAHTYGTYNNTKCVFNYIQIKQTIILEHKILYTFVHVCTYTILTYMTQEFYVQFLATIL